MLSSEPSNTQVALVGAIGHQSALLVVARLFSCCLQAQNGIEVPSVARLVAQKLRKFMHAAGRRCLMRLLLGCPIRLAVLEAYLGIEESSVVTDGTKRAGGDNSLPRIPSCVSIWLVSWEGSDVPVA